jgi:hypothetical protein
MNTINNKIDKQYELYVNDTKTILRFNQLSFNIKELDKNIMNSYFPFVFTYDQLNENSQHIIAGLKADYFYNDAGLRNTKKADYTSDGILYEFDENGNKMQCLDLRVMMLEGINDINSYISLYCDWYLINPDSYTGNMICKLQEEAKIQYNSQMMQYNQLKQRLAKDLDINPNESIFSNNFRKSYNKIDWFKPYKI